MGFPAVCLYGCLAVGYCSNISVTPLEFTLAYVECAMVAKCSLPSEREIVFDARRRDL